MRKPEEDSCQAASVEVLRQRGQRLGIVMAADKREAEAAAVV
jgi:hypothetical protein